MFCVSHDSLIAKISVLVCCRRSFISSSLGTRLRALIWQILKPLILPNWWVDNDFFTFETGADMGGGHFSMGTKIILSGEILFGILWRHG